MADSDTPQDTADKSVLPETDADPETDEAVDDIMKKDGDEVLKAQDEVAEKNVVMKLNPWERFKNFVAGWWANPRKRYATIGAIAIIIIVIFAVPFTRANALGLVLKASVTVRAVDSKSGEPVSGATVELAGQTAETDANGKATLKVHAGSKSLTVTKKYYTGYTHGELVAIPGSHNSFKATLVATGRQVKVQVVNKVSGKPVAGASISASGAAGKTDKDGLATVVIPSGADTQSASVSLDGYNTAKVNIMASGDLATNTFSITPSGKLYFLSNLSGSLDVVKTNLDGTDRQTVLAGTGSEDRQQTSLLASRDWKYLALLSKRSGANPSVYLIDTTNNDKLTTVDEGNASFSFVGWSGDNFIYEVDRTSTTSVWQPNRYALKSLNAETGQTLLLDQTQGMGTDTVSYASQTFGSPYIIGNQVVYAKNWTGHFWFSNTSLLNDKQAELDSINADGSGHKVIKSFSVNASGAAPTDLYITTELYEPSGLYIWVPASLNGGTDQFYDYDNGGISTNTTLTAATFYDTPYPTYLLSPSGNSTFWADQRDGKNTLFIGNGDAQTPQQIAALSDYNTYGWYTDDYLLVSENSSELYILPVAGGTPLKITDYYKPAINYQGYGGGYGGL